MAPKILFVLTSRGQMDNGKPTGWYLPEFARPYYHLVGPNEASPKAEIVVASPLGGVAPIDQGSVTNFQNDPVSVNFFDSKKKLWQETKPLKDFLGKASEFDAIFYPGGHGPMFDLATDKDSIKLIEEFYKAGKFVAAVCHGPIVFTNVTVDGKPLLQGRKATGFSNAEEDAVGLTDAMPALLEDEIKRVGGDYVKADQIWGEKVVVDGRIATGQNPASAYGVGVAIANAVGL